MYIRLHCIGNYKCSGYPHPCMLEVGHANISHAYRKREKSEISSEVIFFYQPMLVGDQQ